MTHVDITLEREGDTVMSSSAERATLEAVVTRARQAFPDAMIRARFVPEDGRTHWWPIVSCPEHQSEGGPA